MRRLMLMIHKSESRQTCRIIKIIINTAINNYTKETIISMFRIKRIKKKIETDNNNSSRLGEPELSMNPSLD